MPIQISLSPKGVFRGIWPPGHSETVACEHKTQTLLEKGAWETGNLPFPDEVSPSAGLLCL